MRRTKEDAEQTRKRIMDTALERFATKGVDACSLAEIASCAGLTRGAIYWHFKNREELLETIVFDFAAPLIAMENAILDENEADPLGKLRSLLIFLLQHIANDQVYRRIVVLCQRMRSLSFNESLNGEYQPSCLDDLTAQRRARRMEVLKNAVKKGQLPSHLDCPAAANFILASVEGIAFAWLAEPDSFSLDALSSHYVDAILLGITGLTV